MKKRAMLLAAVVCMGMILFTGCGGQTEDPGTPPEDVIHPVRSAEPAGISGQGSPAQEGSASSAEGENRDGDSKASGSGEVLNNAVSVRIGRDGKTEYSIDMYDNAAAKTMLGYLSGSALLFPTYTYDGQTGYVGQSIRGTYTVDDQVEVTDIRKGELYLFGDKQLRLYFKDVKDAGITATPVGYVVDTESLTEAVEGAYESNLGDTWGVDVYFWITKN